MTSEKSLDPKEKQQPKKIQKVRRRRSRRQVEFHTGDHEIYNGERLLGGISDENPSGVGSRSIIEARMYCNTFQL